VPKFTVKPVLSPNPNPNTNPNYSPDHTNLTHSANLTKPYYL